MNTKIKTPLAVRNNNPLNIRFSPMNNWLGQIGSNKGFCVFDTMEHGFRAALVLLCNYQRKGYDTVSKIITHWAPASENNTKAYIDYVVSDDFIFGSNNSIEHNSRDKRITNFVEIRNLCWKMAKFEIGTKYIDSIFQTSKFQTLNRAHTDAEFNYKYPELKK